jgi:hypothetical protein
MYELMRVQFFFLPSWLLADSGKRYIVSYFIIYLRIYCGGTFNICMLLKKQQHYLLWCSFCSTWGPKCWSLLTEISNLFCENLLSLLMVIPWGSLSVLSCGICATPFFNDADDFLLIICNFLRYYSIVLNITATGL